MHKMFFSFFPMAFFLALAFTGYTSVGFGQTNPADLLRQAEMKRAPWPEMELEARLEGTDRRGKTMTSSYKVLFKDEIKTLAGFIEPKFEKGNLLLMVGEDLWYYVKETRRPTRITPMQRLSGAVSYGDLARLHWTNDYSVESVDENADTHLGKSTIRLNLQAKSSGATYQKVHLWIEAGSNKPIKCDVFLLSGKRFKTIEFTRYEMIDGKEVNVEMQFTDHLMKGTSSKMIFEGMQRKTDLADRYFIKTSLPDISKEFIK